MLLGRPGSLWVQLVLLGPRLGLGGPLALVLPLSELLFLILLLLRTLLHRGRLAHQRMFVRLRRTSHFALLLRPVLIRIRPVLPFQTAVVRLVLRLSVPVGTSLVGASLIRVRPCTVLLRARFVLRLWRLTVRSIHLHPL